MPSRPLSRTVKTALAAAVASVAVAAFVLPTTGANAAPEKPAGNAKTAPAKIVPAKSDAKAKPVPAPAAKPAAKPVPVPPAVEPEKWKERKLPSKDNDGTLAFDALPPLDTVSPAEIRAWLGERGAASGEQGAGSGEQGKSPAGRAAISATAGAPAAGAAGAGASSVPLVHERFAHISIPAAAQAAHSPDPLLPFRWQATSPDDALQLYVLRPVAITSSNSAGTAPALSPRSPLPVPRSLRITAPTEIRLDFGRVSPAWFEFDLPTDADAAAFADADVFASISEFNAPAVFNAGSQHPRKTARLTRAGKTCRLVLNREFYEGVRYAWLHVRALKRPFAVSNLRLVCQTKPVNYDGAFLAANPVLTRAWHTGAYTVRANLLRDYFGAILMERSDRHSWTGDAHTAQAAALAAFGNFDFVKKNIRYTSTQDNGIASYALYWVLSVCDYFMSTGDAALLDEMRANANAKLDRAAAHFGKRPRLRFFGWDERLGAGFENANCPEAQLCYQFLAIQTWREWSRVLAFAGHADDAAKYAALADEKTAALQRDSAWLATLSAHSAAAAVNAGFPFEYVAGGVTARDTALASRLSRLSYSPFNQYFILQALAKLDRRADALATLDDCWGGQLRYGATTFFEVFRPSWVPVASGQWSVASGKTATGTAGAGVKKSLTTDHRPLTTLNPPPPNNQCGYTSLAHPWSAGVTKWLTDEVAGIKPLAPGYKTFLVRPWLNRPHNPWVRAKVPTPAGAIEFGYNITPDQHNGEGYLVVPKGTRAYLSLPSGFWGGHQVFDAAGKPRNIGRRDWDGVYNFPSEPLPAGRYTFKIGGHYPEFTQTRPSEPAITYPWTTPFVDDARTGGLWRGKYGAAGYLLFNYDGENRHRQQLPAWLAKVTTGKAANTVYDTAGKNDPRALQSPDAAAAGAAAGARRLGALRTQDPRACMQTMFLDLHLKDAGTATAGTAAGGQKQKHKVTLYLCDYDRQHRRAAIEVFDLKTKELLAPVYFVNDYAGGRHITLETDRSIRIRINQVRGPNATVSAVFFD
ncbi:MAG: hypothetical protein LBR07_01845 [Puniceicoccales bacterium]|nr:hypothetical protein [Puniceicoccales bacterium]